MQGKQCTVCGGAAPAAGAVAMMAVEQTVAGGDRFWLFHLRIFFTKGHRAETLRT